MTRQHTDEHSSGPPSAGDPPDPRTAGSAHDLVERLNELRLWAGQPSLRALRRLAGTTVSGSGEEIDALPTSTTSYLLNGRGLPRLPRMEFVESFVAACLRSVGREPAQITAEIERWRDAWTRIARGAPVLAGNGRVTPEPATREPDPVTGPATRGPATTTGPATREPATREPATRGPAIPEPESAGALAPGPVRSGTRRLPAAAGVVAAVVAVTAGVLAWQWARTPDPAGSADQAGVPVLRRDHITGVTHLDGVDLDTGTVARNRQNAPGVEFSPYGRGNHLVTRTSAMALLLQEPGPESYQRCADAPVRDRVQWIKGLHGVRAGTNLCFWTTDGRVAMVTFDVVPAPEPGTLEFRSIVWDVGA